MCSFRLSPVIMLELHLNASSALGWSSLYIGNFDGYEIIVGIMRIVSAQSTELHRVYWQLSTDIDINRMHTALLIRLLLVG